VVKQQLQALNGVGGVDIIGGQEREFHVWIDPQRLESYGLAVGDVTQAMVAQNVEIPGGRLDVGKNELSIKTRGQVFSARELGNIIITAAAGSPVRIADVARVEDGAEESTAPTPPSTASPRSRCLCASSQAPTPSTFRTRCSRRWRSCARACPKTSRSPSPTTARSSPRT
jgi:hypothetical protein